MATLKFTGSGHWVVNVFHDWNHPDPDYELVSPNKSVNVAINHTPTYITLYGSAHQHSNLINVTHRNILILSCYCAL